MKDAGLKDAGLKDAGLKDTGLGDAELGGPQMSDSGRKRPRILVIAGFFFAAVSSACCWLAWLLAALGVGTAAAASFEPLRPVALGLALLLVIFANGLAWRKVGRLDPPVVVISVVALVVAFLHH